MAEKIFVGTLENQQKILSIMEGTIPKRYGYRVKINEGDTEKRVEYILDAAGMTPAHMDFSSGSFDYGSWKDIWFVKRNYPVVLNRDGSEAYRLNPDDFSKREDGDTSETLPSGVTLDKLTNGENVMSAIPLVWVKRYQEDGYRYVIFCETQFDESYKAYAHTNANGDVMPYAYHACYEGYLDSTDAATAPTSQAAIITTCKYAECPNKSTCKDVASAKITDSQCQAYMRSVSGVQPTCFTTAYWERSTAQRNGPGWDLKYWSLNELIADLLTLMGKDCNTQKVFGQGHTERNSSSLATPAAMMLTGTMDKKGQFWGSNSTKPTAAQCPGDTTSASATETGVKVFFIENFWGDRWERQLGMCAKNGDLLIKMTPEDGGYNLEATGYTAVQEAKLGEKDGNGYRKHTVQTEYGALPIAPFTGSSDTYESDFFWFQVDGTVRVSFFGGACHDGATCGARSRSVYNPAGRLGWDCGGSLTYLSSSR